MLNSSNKKFTQSKKLLSYAHSVFSCVSKQNIQGPFWHFLRIGLIYVKYSYLNLYRVYVTQLSGPKHARMKGTKFDIIIYLSKQPKFKPIFYYE